MDPPESMLALENSADTLQSSDIQPGTGGKPAPPPSWKKRNPLTEYKKNLARKGTFPEGEGEEKYADGSVYKGERSQGKQRGCDMISATGISTSTQASVTGKAVFGGPIVDYMLEFSAKGSCTVWVKYAIPQVGNTTAS